MLDFILDATGLEDEALAVLYVVQKVVMFHGMFLGAALTSSCFRWFLGFQKWVLAAFIGGGVILSNLIRAAAEVTF